MAVAMWLLPGALPAPADVGALDGRLAYALRWCAFASLPFFVMIAAIGNARALGAAIDPTLGLEDRKMQINGRVADNTLQQYMLFFAGALALAAGLPPASIRVIGAAAIVFVAARILFWIGYRIDPLYRAFGFAATIYLNLGLLLAALWFAIS
jgi:uncharacterized MAPEG superfamily protein